MVVVIVTLNRKNRQFESKSAVACGCLIVQQSSVIVAARCKIGGLRCVELSVSEDAWVKVAYLISWFEAGVPH